MPQDWILAVGCGVVAGAANVTGGVLAIGTRTWDHVRQSYLVAAGAGFMLAAVILRMIPESYRLNATPGASSGALSVGLLLLAGYLLVHFAEHVLLAHFHYGEETHHEHWVQPVVGTTALLGLAFHTLFDGVSIGSGFLITPTLGILIAVAVFLHKIPEGFTVASIMVAAGRSRRDAVLSATVLGLVTVAGVLGISFWSSAVHVALPLSAGAGLYVAATDLIPAVNEAKGVRKPLAVFGGVALFAVTEIFLESLGL
ncbi:MAG TPA: ZIP family metal transporter [Acidobacteriota bacterium]|nr:ZIP family metal transporter [Acidobacteriota bacterium]